MPLIKCSDGVHRSVLAALDADALFASYDDEETPTPDHRDAPPAEVEDDVRW